MDRLDRQRRPADLHRGVDLLGAGAGDRNHEVARDREVVEAVVRRVGAHQHDRVGVVVASPGRSCRRCRCRAAGSSSSASEEAAALLVRAQPPRPGRAGVFASVTPLENDDQPATPQTTTRTMRSARPSGDPAGPNGRASAPRRVRGTGSTRSARRASGLAGCRRPAGCRASGREPFPAASGRGRRDRASRPAPSGGLGYPANMSANRVIGVDLGGTKILAGSDRRRRRHARDPSSGRRSRPRRTRSSTSSSRRCRSLPHDGVAGGRLRHPVADRPRARHRARRREHPAARCAVSRRDGAAARPAGRDRERRDAAPPTPSTASAPGAARATS